MSREDLVLSPSGIPIERLGYAGSRLVFFEMIDEVTYGADPAIPEFAIPANLLTAGP